MKPALLVIDVQNEYFAPHGKWVLPDGEAALPHIQALLAAARDTGIPIVHITHEELDPNSPIFQAGSHAVDMHPAIDARPGEKLIKKHFPGSFTGTPLEAYLRQKNIDTVIISGFMTQMCCDTTTRQADERGLATLFASDATAARDLTLNGQIVPHQVIHEMTLAIMTQFAAVMATEDIIKKLGNE